MLKDRESKLKLAVQKTEADLQLIDDEEDQFQVKISVQDFEILKLAKLQNIGQNVHVNQGIFLQPEQAMQ